MADDAVVLDYLINEGDAERALRNVEKGMQRTGRTIEQESKRGTSALGGLRRGLGLISSLAGGIAIGATLRKSIVLFEEQEKAVGRVTGALRTQGIRSRAVTSDLEAYASSLQDVTTYGDEAYLSAISLSLAMGANVDQAKELAAAAADLSVALGVSLDTAAGQLARTLGGLRGELGERLPELAQFSAAQLRSGAAIGLVRDRFGGMAAGLADTSSGRYEQAKNAFGDELENLGAVVLPAFTTAVTAATATLRFLGIGPKERPPTAAEIARGQIETAAQGDFAKVKSLNDRLERLGLGGVAAPSVRAELERVQRQEDALKRQESLLNGLEAMQLDMRKRGWLDPGDRNRIDPTTGRRGADVVAEFEAALDRRDQIRSNIERAGVLSATRIREYELPGLASMTSLLNTIGEAGPAFDAAKTLFDAINVPTAEALYQQRIAGINAGLSLYGAVEGDRAGGGINVSAKAQAEADQLRTAAGMEFLAADSPALVQFHEEFKQGIFDATNGGLVTALRGGGVRGALMQFSQTLADSVSQSLADALTQKLLGGLLGSGGGLDKALLSILGLGGEAGAGAK